MQQYNNIATLHMKKCIHKMIFHSVFNNYVKYEKGADII